MMLTRNKVSKKRSVIFLVVMSLACQPVQEKETMFELLSGTKTGVNFKNTLEETVDMNIFNYMYFYNGGGVAVGDMNGDGLMDIFFTSNQNSNKLYLNQGDFQFRDVTTIAEVEGFNSWTTGVSIADVNGDGLLDIYVCYLGDYLGERSRNQLLINQGNNEKGIPIFKDEAPEYGLDFVGFSTQAVFFDYDLDGDLDLFLLNHSVHNNGTFGPSSMRSEPHPTSGDRLFKNENGFFIDVTFEAGIFSSALGYGLGVAISDVNLNGYPDIYVGNDFHENDYLYINNGDGTFTNMLESAMQHTSHFTMGVDFGDINNDGFPELIALDMLPAKPDILKASAAEDPYDVFNFKLDFGYSHQFARNTLQLNNRNESFSEIGLFSGIYATDWSWSTFFADLDLDGQKDIFIANGILRRSNDLDYINFITDEKIQNDIQGEIGQKELELVKKMPTIKIPNYVFRNNGDLTFEDVSQFWGLGYDSYSNGASYVDLNNDGALDIVVNNINDEAFIFHNKVLESQVGNFLKVNLSGKPGNNFGIGAKVLVYTGNQMQLQECMPVRGFQSSSDYRLNFGLGENGAVDSLIVIWPDRTFQKFKKVIGNQVIILNQIEAKGEFDYSIFHQKESQFITKEGKEIGINFVHKENKFNEFNREFLLPKMLSQEGPAVAVGDINGDGLDDIFFGGAKHQAAEVYVQNQNGKFDLFKQPQVSLDSLSEDVQAYFGDFNNNGHLDLIVTSGGNEFSGNHPNNQPRLYLNDGKGNFKKSIDAFKGIYLTSGSLTVADYDLDGDLDVFIGGRTTPWKYGEIPRSYLLINDGDGVFEDKTKDLAPNLEYVGLVTDSRWVHLTDTNLPDLIIATEWEPIKIFKNNKGRLDLLEDTKWSNMKGWWQAIIPGDIDDNGLQDFIVGNWGVNSKLKASTEEPIRMYYSDFDDNGNAEQILTHYMDGDEYPFNTKDELSKQLPSLIRKYVSYKEFSKQTLADIFDIQKLKAATKFEVNQMNSLIFKNQGNYDFKIDTLPKEAQFAPIIAGSVLESGKGVLLGGNFFPVNVQLGRYDASYGVLLTYDKASGMMEYATQDYSGLKILGQIKSIHPIKLKNSNAFLVVGNNMKPIVLFSNE
ncbi:Repeat domain-containing protein [Belliella buryatensis]|uniref:Repeat domain-containing protein n=1 Tax=Belliella buryatensis TaxID=1500549 RepID=A0A239B694_9BACT|nr:VCBS repeat-containing protein [Belliella buryatensis]SNS02763.1 Repeat domain-containing protein [Belliella buryatensis]